MSDYIITFYSHFGAMRYKKEAEQAGIPAILMPVPRYLSSSCGTCVRLADVETAALIPTPTHPDEIEMIVRMTGEDSCVEITLNDR